MSFLIVKSLHGCLVLHLGCSNFLLVLCNLLLVWGIDSKRRHVGPLLPKRFPHLLVLVFFFLKFNFTFFKHHLSLISERRDTFYLPLKVRDCTFFLKALYLFHNRIRNVCDSCQLMVSLRHIKLPIERLLFKVDLFIVVVFLFNEILEELLELSLHLPDLRRHDVSESFIYHRDLVEQSTAVNELHKVLLIWHRNLVACRDFLEENVVGFVLRQLTDLRSLLQLSIVISLV